MTLRVSCCALIGYAVWAQGGTLPALQPPMLALGALIFMLLIVDLRGSVRTVLFRDPVFWTGLLLLLIIVVQIVNSGRELYFHPETDRWLYAPPPIPFAPWSFARWEAFEMLYWFMPAWALALALRHAPRRGRLGRTLIYFVAVNGLLLALAGIVQWIQGSSFLFWHTPPRTRFYFASFFYRNHAGGFLALTLAVTLGLLSYHIRWRRHARATLNVPAVWGLGAGIVVLMIAMHTALSRAGIVICWILIALFLGSLMMGEEKLHGNVRRLQAGAVLLMILAIALSWAAILGGDALSERAQTLHTWVRQVETRHWQWEAAVRIWQDHPVWGVGAWGYRYLLPFYVEEPLLRDAAYPGKANVHNDFLQYLAEFGIAGLALLLGTVAMLASRFVRGWKSVWARPVSRIYTFAFAGVILIAVHSIIDLPFRNPAILYTWIILLTAVPAGWSAASGSKHRL